MNRWLMTDPDGRAGPRRRGGEQPPMGRCAECGRRTFAEFLNAARRLGGGTYNRAPRWYSSRICTECVVQLRRRLVNIGDVGTVGSALWMASTIRKLRG